MDTEAARREAARRELRAIYRRVEAEVADRSGFRCEMSGRCCRFREANHMLYLTSLEFDEMAARGGPPEGDAAEACPWLRGGLCANREGRALACRTYFCSDEAGAAGVTERYHAEIRTVHERYRIPYRYGSLWSHVNR